MNGSCSFYPFMTFLLVALDVGYVGITKSWVFSTWAIVRHMRSIDAGHVETARIYGGRSTDMFGGLVGRNCKVKMVE